MRESATRSLPLHTRTRVGVDVFRQHARVSHLSTAAAAGVRVTATVDRGRGGKRAYASREACILPFMCRHHLRAASLWRFVQQRTRTSCFGISSFVRARLACS